jgi:hypothetical protein
MEGKKTIALGRDGLRRTENPRTIEGRQLKTTIHQTQEPGHSSGKRQSEARASRSRDNVRDGQHMELDEHDRENHGKGDGERNKGIEEADDQSKSDGIENTEDVRDDAGDESESKSFVETYRDYRSYIRKATRREAEEEFLRNKRELIGLPKEHKQNEKQQRPQRFCAWALRQIKRRIKVLHEEEVARGEDSGSDGLSESNENKMWKMYGIIAEDDTQYLVAWKGTYKKTNQEYGDEWTAKENVEGKGKREWQAYKAKKARGEEL